VVAEQAVSFKIEILRGSESGTVVFRETHSVTTNKLGVATLPIIGGTHDGMWMPIDWSTDVYYLKVYLDLNNGTDFTAIGTSPILAVPVATYAESAGEAEAVANLPADAEFDNISVTGSLVVGSTGVIVSNITIISATTDAINNYTEIALPDGFSRNNTHVLGVEITTSSGSPFVTYYSNGLGFTGTNGTVGYQVISKGIVIVGQPSQVVKVYYPDELKNKSVQVILMKKTVL
jgi:hypothetical protein